MRFSLHLSLRVIIMLIMNDMRRQSGKMALCSMLAALSALIMTAGGFIPVATFLSPMIAAAALIPVMVEYGRRPALIMYGAVALLALFLSPDKESAVLYAFLGWYPAIIPTLGKVRSRIVRIALKLALFLLIVSLAYYLMIAVFDIGDMAREFQEYSILTLLLLFLMGSVTFLLCDLLYQRLEVRYRNDWRKRLWKGHQ